MEMHAYSRTKSQDSTMSVEIIETLSDDPFQDSDSDSFQVSISITHKADNLSIVLLTYHLWGLPDRLLAIV